MSMDKKDVEDNKPIVQPKKDEDSSSDDISKLKQMQADKDESSSEIAKTLSQKNENKQCNDKCSVVIKNIDKGVTETEIRTFLKGCGKIKKISIPKTKKGQFQNLAYVEFCNVADVSIALSLSGASMMNKKVFVFRKKALPRRK